MCGHNTCNTRMNVQDIEDRAQSAAQREVYMQVSIDSGSRDANHRMWGWPQSNRFSIMVDTIDFPKQEHNLCHTHPTTTHDHKWTVGFSQLQDSTRRQKTVVHHGPADSRRTLNCRSLFQLEFNSSWILLCNPSVTPKNKRLYKSYLSCQMVVCVVYNQIESSSDA